MPSRGRSCSRIYRCLSIGKFVLKLSRSRQYGLWTLLNSDVVGRMWPGVIADTIEIPSVFTLRDSPTR